MPAALQVLVNAPLEDPLPHSMHDRELPHPADKGTIDLLFHLLEGFLETHPPQVHLKRRGRTGQFLTDRQERFRRGPLGLPLPLHRLKIAGWNVAAINCSFGSSNSGGLGSAADYLIAQAEALTGKPFANYWLLTGSLTINGEKMSKSRGNVVNPDQVVTDYGADSMRLYEMFMGPLEATKPWSMQGVEGISRFLNRAWRMIIDEAADDLRHDQLQAYSAKQQGNQQQEPCSLWPDMPGQQFYEEV